MHIVLVQDYLRQGGTETQTLFLAKRFHDCGHRVTIVTFRPGGVLSGALAGSGVGWRVLQPFDTRLNFFAPHWRKTLEGLKADIVMTMGRMANRVGWRIHKALPAVTTVATMRSGKALPADNWRSFRTVPATVVNAVWAKSMLVDGNVPEDRIDVIYNACTKEVRFPDPAKVRADVRRMQRTDTTTMVFISVAGFREGKGQLVLIDVLSRLQTIPDWELWFLGDGPTLESCKEQARARGLEKKVRFLGRRAEPDVFYAGADIAIHASKYESLPNFLVEAQMAGLPVVATPAGGSAETFFDGESGFLVPHEDEDQFLHCIQKLVNDAELRMSMSKVAAGQAAKRFAPEASINAYLNLFAELRAKH